MRRLLALLFVALVSAAPAPAADRTTVRLAAWNIANLSHVEGVPLRPNIGTVRRAEDFAALRRYAEALDADIVALQEIGTIEAAALLFPPPAYAIYPSARLRAATIDDAPDVHTAIAVRNRPGLVVLAQEDVEALAVIHAPDGRLTRDGVAVLVEAGDTRFWALSVHLKSSCPVHPDPSTSANQHCVTLWAQQRPLRDWIAAREAQGEAFAVMGDFNRRFRETGFADAFWLGLGPDGVSPPALTAHPETAGRLCPTRRGAGTEPIDWIVLDPGLAARFVPGSFAELLFDPEDVEAHGGPDRTRLSDHCPIRIDLMF